MTTRVDLLINASVTGAPAYWPGGEAEFIVSGNLNGATVTLMQMNPDNATYQPVGAGTTLTAPGNGVAILGAGVVKAVVSGGSPSGLFASLDVVAG